MVASDRTDPMAPTDQMVLTDLMDPTDLMAHLDHPDLLEVEKEVMISP